MICTIDNVKISGNDHFYDNPEGIKQTIKLLDLPFIPL